MTREEFIDTINDFGDLIYFCGEEGCDYLDNVYDEDSRDEYVDDRLVDMARECGSWKDLRDILGDIPYGGGYYRQDEYGDGWIWLNDDDFDDYKNDVIEWMDNRGNWDEEDDEEELVEPEASTENEEDDEVFEEEPIPVNELFTMCNAELKVINRKNQEEEVIDDSDFNSFIEAASLLSVAESI